MIQEERIENRIYLIRGQKVMIDMDLAELYGVKTKELNKAVIRNVQRFPPDFMFQLSKDEFSNLRFQFGTSSWGGRRYLPYVFTEHGIAMLSSVINNEQAIQVNIAIVRAFVKLRQILANHKELAREFKKLEQRIDNHDKEIRAIFDAIRKLMEPPKVVPKKIGFLRD